MSKSDKLPSEPEAKNKARRDFLRKSMYAAYATPVITALLVNNASAAHSWNNGKGNNPDSDNSDDE